MTPQNKPFLYCLLLPCLLLGSGCEMKPSHPCTAVPDTCEIPKPPHRQHSNATSAATAETTETAVAPRAETMNTAAKSAEQPTTKPKPPALSPATATEKPTVKSSPGLKTRFYTIQLGAYQKAASRKNAISRFQDRHNLYHYPIREQLTAVSYGIYTSRESAEQVLPQIRSQGFSDPLIRTLPLDFRRVE